MQTFRVVQYVNGKRSSVPVATGQTFGAAWDLVASKVRADWGKRVEVRDVRYSVEEER